MAGNAAARALTLQPRAPRFAVALAAATDEADVRRLLRENPFAGDISLSLEREPDSRLAGSIEGDVHQTIVARDHTSGRVAAVATRSVRDAFVNGRRTRLGYLSQLRIAVPYRRHRSLLAEGFRFCRDLHETGDAPIYIASAISDNQPAHHLLARLSDGRRSLTRSAGRAPERAMVPDAPRFEPLEELVTLAIPLRRSGPLARPQLKSAANIGIERGTPDLLPDIVACLQRNGRRHQFALHWSLDDFGTPERLRGLATQDFFLAFRGGDLVGCVARWDQRGFKQAVVRGYSRRLATWRPLINLAGPWCGIPRLPPVGSSLNFAYLSHVAIDDDDEEVFVGLVDAVMRDCVAGDLEYLVTMLAGRSPLLTGLARRVRHRRYPSLLYVACWPDGEPVARSLDGRVPHVEAAVL